MQENINTARYKAGALKREYPKMCPKSLHLHLLGTGTSSGVPAPLCGCPACTSNDPLDKRTRTSAYLHSDSGVAILIDCGPDLRAQALENRIEKISSVLITHAHADHIHGIDDLRSFSIIHEIPVFSSQSVLDEIQARFSYIFTPYMPFGQKPKLILSPIEGTFETCGISITPIPVMHGDLPILGYRFGNTAYITDSKTIPEESMTLLKGIEILIINTLSDTFHPAHMSYDETIEVIKAVDATRIYTIHMAHSFPHAKLQRFFDDKVANEPLLSGKKITVAYDNLIIEGIKA